MGKVIDSFDDSVIRDADEHHTLVTQSNNNNSRNNNESNDMGTVE